MPETKNELAELAEKLKADEDVLRTYKEELGVGDNEIGGLVIADIRKASRIVAELAKVETPYDLVGLVGKCHAIAGECQEVDAEIPDEDRDENFQENC